MEHKQTTTATAVANSVATGNSHHKKSLISRIAYSFGAFGHDMFYGMLSTYFMMFITGHLFSNNAGNDAARMVEYITIIIMALRIVELIIDPYIGNVIDKTDTRWGHFKPWVVGGGVISAISIALLFTDLGGLNHSDPWLYLGLFAVLYIVMDIFYSFNDIAFWSMIPAISFDSAEREKTATFARVGSTLGGNLVGVIVMPVVLFFSLSQNGGTGDGRGWFAFAAIVAGIAAITAIGVGLFTHEKQNELRENKENTTFKQVLGILVKNDQLMAISLAYVLYTTGITLLNSFELYYFTYILGQASMFTAFALINGIIGIFTVSLFPTLAKKFSRKKVFYCSLAVLFAAITLFIFAGRSLVLTIIAGVLVALPQPLVFLVVLMIITDSVEYGQLKLGHRDEGLVLSVRPLLDKFGGAVAQGVIGLTASAAGMIAGATASSITAHGVGVFKTMMFGVPVILLVLSVIVFARKVKLDEAMHAEIVEKLEQTWHKHLEENDNTATTTAATINFLAPVAGKLMKLSDVSDEAFASGQMGVGFAIKPEDGQVFAPFSGTVVATFPTTRHAIGLRSDTGVLVLIHVGVDTAKLQGTGFISYVEQGQHVVAGQKLLEFWAPTIKKAGLDDTVMVAFTKSAKQPHARFEYDDATKQNNVEVAALQSVMTITTD